jgi:hypothetical protein
MARSVDLDHQAVELEVDFEAGDRRVDARFVADQLEEPVLERASRAGTFGSQRLGEAVEAPRR